MSGWGLGWFGGGTAGKKSETPKRAILQLRQQLEMLSKRKTHLESLINDQDVIARKNVNTNLPVAKTALKRKKLHETALFNTESQINTLEQQIYSIESANINKETFDAIKVANKAMADIHGGITIDKVDAIMDASREQQSIAAEISEAIQQPLGGNLLDEDELDAELEQLQQEELDSKMLGTGNIPVHDKIDLPATPQTVKGKTQAVEEDEEEEEIRKLQAEMAL